MFSESFRKIIAKFMLCVLFSTNVLPVFAMQHLDNVDYHINIFQKNSDQTSIPALEVEVLESLTPESTSLSSSVEYRSICTHTIAIPTAATLIDAFKQEISDIHSVPEEVIPNFIDIEGFGRVRVNETGSIILDASTLLDVNKKVAIATDRSVIIDSLQCAGLEIAARSVNIIGNSELKSLSIAIDSDDGSLAISKGSKLSTNNISVDGRIFNYGTLNFSSANSNFLCDESEFLNYGIVSGQNVALKNLGSFFNYGTLIGDFIGLQTNFFSNNGFIGTAESELDFLIHKSFINSHDIVGKSGKITVTSDGQAFENSGLLNITDANFQIAGVLENRGHSVFSNFTGSAKTFLNTGEFEAQDGTFAVNSGENGHILKLGTLTLSEKFINHFKDKSSTMQVNRLLGVGQFCNKSAFMTDENGTIGIREFQNINMDFVNRYESVSFGNTLRFLETTEFIVNEGIITANKISFDGTNAKIQNTQSGVIRAKNEITGKVCSINNDGLVFSENSFISLMFDTIVNRNSFAAQGGVKLQGRHLTNASNLSLCKSDIETLVNNAGSNLWLYFSSNINRMENSGHIEYIKGEHTMNTYIGEGNSEFLLPKLNEVTIPLYLVGDRKEATEYVGTKVTWNKTIGSGQIKAKKITTGDLDEFKNFSLHGDEIEATVTKLPQALPTFSGNLSILANFRGFTNNQNIALPGARLVFDLMGCNFDNTGSIACREFLLSNCGVFRNRSKIETYGDINIAAKQLFNVCAPTTETKITTPNTTHPHRTQERFFTRYTFNKLGLGYMRSHAGSIILNGENLVRNEYSYLSAANHFHISSPNGSIINHVGHMYALGSTPSYINSRGFEESCDPCLQLADGKFYFEGCKGDWSWEFSGSTCGLYNPSEKARIFTAGDLHLNVRQSPVIKGSDIASGGTIFLDAPGTKLDVQNVNQLIPQIVAHNKIIVNGKDIGITGALFLSGYGITLTASGQIVVVNPSGNKNVVPPKGAIDISLREIAKRMYAPLLARPLLAPNAGIAASHQLIMDPTNGMKRLFIGRSPNPLKKLMFDMNLMSIIPMILSDMVGTFSTQALNTQGLLSLMNENAKALSNTQLVASHMPNKPLLYFEIKDLDDKTEIAEPYLHITTDMMRNALTTNVGIICENGPVSMKAHDMYLDRAVVSGTNVELTAVKDNTLQNASITAIGSQIAADQTLKIKAADGVTTNATFNVTEHRTSGRNEYTTIQTAEIVPSIIAGNQIILDGGSSQLRGTIVSAKELLDTTENLTIGVNKQRLEYESYKRKYGFFSSSSIHHTGWHEMVAPSVLQVEKMLSIGNGNLEFESVLAQKLQQLMIQKPIFRETAATVASHDNVETHSSGLFFNKVSISDPLVNAWQNLIHSNNAKALIGSAISSTAAIIGSVEDAKNLLGAFAGGINADAASIIAGTLLKRYVNVGFSIGSTTTTTTTHQTHQLPNKINAELIRLDCPTLVQLQGHHDAHDFIVNTETFNTNDMVSTKTVDSNTQSTTFSMNLMSAVIGATLLPLSGGMAAAVGGASSVSASDVSQKSSQIVRDATTILADRFILRVGNAHLTDTQIRARLVDAIIRGDIVLESLCDEFFNEASGGSFSIGFGFLGLTNGIQNMMDAVNTFSGTSGAVIDVQEIDKRINAFTNLVGEEKFNITVGGKLIQKQQQEERSKRDESFTIPLGDLLTVASKLSLRDEIAKVVEVDASENGISDSEKLSRKQKAYARLELEKKRAETVSDNIDATDKQFAQELETSIDSSELQNLKDGKPVAQSTKNALKVAAQKAKTSLESSKTLESKRTASTSTDLEGSILSSSQEATIGFYDDRIDWYNGLLKSLSTPEPTLKRSGSTEFKVETTITKIEDRVKEQASHFMKNSRAVRSQGFGNAWRQGKVFEYLTGTTASVMVDDALPIIGKGIDAADDVTCGAVSTALSAINPATYGTAVRRGLRDGLGASQRVAQNAGDVVQYLGEVALLVGSFGSGSVAKGANVAEATFVANKAKRVAQFESVVKENVRLTAPLNFFTLRSYVREIEGVSGLPVAEQQRVQLCNALREKNYVKLRGKELNAHKEQYTKPLKKSLIAEWEVNTGQKWPTYESSSLHTGTIEVKQYQFHHIIPQQYGGPHAWWNGYPIPVPEHQALTHSRKGALYGIIKSLNKGK